MIRFRPARRLLWQSRSNLALPFCPSFEEDMWQNNIYWLVDLSQMQKIAAELIADIGE